jgi:Flp pilus assembly protein TadB
VVVFRSANRISRQNSQVGSSHVFLLSFFLSTYVVVKMAAVLTWCFVCVIFFRSSYEKNNKVEIKAFCSAICIIVVT